MHPDFPRARAIAFPIPLEAPVTTATGATKAFSTPATTGSTAATARTPTFWHCHFIDLADRIPKQTPQSNRIPIRDSCFVLTRWRFLRWKPLRWGCQFDSRKKRRTSGSELYDVVSTKGESLRSSGGSCLIWQNCCNGRGDEGGRSHQNSILNDEEEIGNGWFGYSGTGST